MQFATYVAQKKIAAMKNIVRDVIAEKCQLPQVEATVKDAADFGLQFSPAVHEFSPAA